MARTKVNHIIRFEHGTTDYPGAKQSTFDVNEGQFVPDMNEGEIYPKGSDNVGVSDGFPLTGQITHEDVASFAALLTASVGDLLVVGKAAGGGNNEKFTGANALFNQGNLELSRQADAQMQMSCFCYSADGSAHPFTRSSVLDSTAPTGTKVKTNNIVSAAHPAIPGTGIVSVRVRVNRGEHIPDIDQEQLYASGADLVGTRQQYPIMVTVTLEDAAAASHVGTSSGDLVLTAKAAQGQANQVITLSNARVQSGQDSIRRQQDGTFALEMFCESADGSALPLSVADVV